jgi:hypothetical protein
VQLGRTQSAGRTAISTIGSVVFIYALLVFLFLGAVPGWATVTAPGSASVVLGSSVSVNVTTDGNVVQINPGTFAVRSGTAPSFRFTFTVPPSANPGAYGYTFFDDVGGSSSFTLIVEASPPAPTTIPPTPTTIPPAPTTIPPAPTTTKPPVTTTTTLITTTVPPATTTSTLVPAGVIALSSGDTRTIDPIALLGGGVALVALALAGAYWYRSTRPAYGSTSPWFLVAWRRRSQLWRDGAPGRRRRRSGFGGSWRASGPVVAYQERRASRQAGKAIRKKIEERKRLSGS